MELQEVINLSRFIGPYWTLGIEHEKYVVNKVMYCEKKATAYCSVENPHMSGYSGKWHLQAITGQALAMQAISIHSHLIAGLEKKETEIWISDISLTTVRPILSPSDIEISLELISRIVVPPSGKCATPRSHLTWKVSFCQDSWWGKFQGVFNLVPKGWIF